nr:hypothetical protein [Tanacetum cinerariifolium]
MYSASSAVTYTSVYTNSEPERVFWGADEELSDRGSPRVIVYGYDGLLMLPVAPPSPDYIPGPEEPQIPPAPQDKHELIQPHDPDFVPEPIYPEYIPLEDEHILLAEEQPLPPVVSPTAESPGYVTESDPEEDPKEYEEDETEDGLVGYPMDGGDDGDDDESNSSGYDADDEDEDEEDEEEHLALADSAVVIPTDELTSISLPPEAEVERLLAVPTLPPSLLTSLSPPSAGERSWFEVGESSTRGQEVDYRFVDAVEAEMRHRAIREVGYEMRDTWIDLAEAVPEMAPPTLEKVNTRVTELAELYEHDTQDLYALLEDAQDGVPALDTPDTATVAEQIMETVTRQGQNLPPPNTDTPPHHMTPESVQAMINQALLRNSTNGDGSQSSHEDNTRNVQTTRPYFYADFIKCHPLNFKGNEGVVGLTQWIKKMESVFNISGCAIENQGELKKLEIELWNLKVKGNDVPTYTNHFQELTLICTKFVANENKKIDNAHHDLLGTQKKLNMTLTKVTEQMTQLTSMCELACQLVQKNLEEKQLEETQAVKAQSWKFPVCYDDDDDEEGYNSLNDNIILELPSDDQSLSDEDVPEKIYLNPLFDEEIILMEIDLHSFNAESDLIESMPNHDSSITISSKIDSLFDEFAGELTLLKSFPPRIDETDCHPKKETRFAKRLLYDNSSPRPPEEIVSDNSNADIESFSPSPIPNEDSDSHMKEINLSFNPDDPMPPSIEDDDYVSGRDVSILEEFLDNYSLSLLASESYHFDIPSPYRPPDQMEKSPDLLSHLGFEAFQPSAECLMIINGKNTPLLDVSLFHFYPLDQLKYRGN